MEIAKLIVFRATRSGFLKSGFPYGCQQVCNKTTDFRWRRKHEDRVGEGSKEHAKKYRQYSEINYQEWRYPKAQRAIDISSTPEIVKPYKSGETGMKSKLSNPKKSLVEAREKYMHNRLLKKHVPDYHSKRFPAEAQQIYIDAHNLLNSSSWTLSKKNDTEEKLHNLVTELAYEEMIKGLQAKTVIWNWIENIEPPSVVQTLCMPMVDDNNYYAQVTLKLHSKQTLVVYDRFGRLMLGDRDIPRNVLEYVVFERHISHPYGRWRIHGKLNEGDYQREPLTRTIAFKQQKPKRADAVDWHRKEREIHHFKWYPLRHKRIAHTNRLERIRRGRKYWSKRRKNYVLYKQHCKLTRMRGKARKIVRRKRSLIDKMRKEGKLPKPPVGAAEPEFEKY